MKVPIKAGIAIAAFGFALLSIGPTKQVQGPLTEVAANLAPGYPL